MSEWHPKLPQGEKIQYRQLADALEQDISSGVLAPGHRLPTVRALAQQLGATTTTISRAYAEADKRGLLRSKVGRGTFVCGRNALSQVITPESSNSINLSIIQPVARLGDDLFHRSLDELSNSAMPASLMNYPHSAGELRHREAGVRWLQYQGIQANNPEQLLLTTGAQHALLTVILGLTQPGDKIAVESICYPGIPAIADSVGRELVGIAMDEYGLIPAAFEQACLQQSLKMLIVTTTCHNPTTATMPERRREQLAAIARRHKVILVDDDIYGFLTRGRATPLFNFAPDITCSISSLSKSLMPGLRTGYLYVPEPLSQALSAAIRTTVWMSSPLTHELATRMIDAGYAAELAERQATEAEARQKIAREELDGFSYQAQRRCYHAWLSLPSGWSAELFQRECQRQGVLVSSAMFFATHRHAVPAAVRISLMAPDSRETLREALQIIRRLLSSPPVVQYGDHF